MAYDKIKIALALGPLTQLELEVINAQKNVFFKKNYWNFAVIDGEPIAFNGFVQFSGFDVLRLDRMDPVLFRVCIVLNQSDRRLQFLAVRR